MKTIRVVCLLLLASVGTAAQVPPGCWPADTSAYLVWRGTASVEPVRGANSLLRLWDDPEFAPVRHAMALQLRAGLKKKAEGGGLVEPPIEEALSLLKNAFVVGLSGLPDLAALRSQPPAAWEPGVFLVYDTTGKLALLRKLIEQAQAEATEKPVITSYEFAGTTVEKVSYPKQTSYRAYAGRYFVLANQKTLIEEILQRTQAREAPADSIRQNALVQAARSFAGEGSQVEFFARIPDLSKAEFPGAKDFDAGALFRALHIERLHALAGSVSLAGERTRVRVALLGDTSSGSLFDLLGESHRGFPTLAAAPAGVSYNAFTFDWAAFYQMLRGALKASLPAEKSSFIEGMEGSLSGQMGMGMPDLLGLVAGEFAWITAEVPTDTSTAPGLFALVIRRPDDVLRLVRLLFGQAITTEERQGDTTYLTFTRSYTDSKTGAERKRFYHAAVTPHVLLISQRKTELTQALSRLASAAGAPAAAGTLGTDAQFVRERASLPGSLTGLSYSDLTRLPWNEFAEGFVAGFSKAIQKSSGEAPPPAAPPPLDPKALAAVLARHLHTYSGGSWKDRNGFFFEGSVK